MKQGTQERSSTHKVSLGRIAGVAVALGGLSGLVLAEGAASAATNVVVSTTKNAKAWHDLGERQDRVHLEGEQDTLLDRMLEDLARSQAAARCEEGHGWERCERFKARDREDEQWRSPGDLRRQAALLLLR